MNNKEKKASKKNKIFSAEEKTVEEKELLSVNKEAEKSLINVCPIISGEEKKINKTQKKQLKTLMRR